MKVELVVPVVVTSSCQTGPPMAPRSVVDCKVKVVLGVQ